MKCEYCFQIMNLIDSVALEDNVEILEIYYCSSCDKAIKQRTFDSEERFEEARKIEVIFG